MVRIILLDCTNCAVVAYMIPFPALQDELPEQGTEA
jgi:hypothetical protein